MPEPVTTEKTTKDQWSQQEGAEEPETNPSVLQQEEQADTTEGEVIADCKPVIDYYPERSDPETEPVNCIEEAVNSTAEYVKIEIPLDGTFKQ